MISEHKFITSFTSVWRELMPLGDSYWRRENLLLKQEHPTVENLVATDMRGLVNELAFMAFCRFQSVNATAKARLIAEPIEKMSIADAVRICVPHAVAYINRLTQPIVISEVDVDKDCIMEACQLTKNLLRFYPEHGTYILRPKFQGCGVLSACEGDLISDGCLYEIKAGARSFRISDVRQLLVYSALAYASNSLTFDRVGLCNPRSGVAWVKSLDSICQSVSGVKAIDVLANLITHFESTDSTQ